MELLSLAIALYFAIGLALVFIGPAARMLRVERNRLRVDAPDRPEWKLAAFSGILALGTILAWPLLVFSAARKEASLKNPTTAWDALESTAAIQGADRTL